MRPTRPRIGAVLGVVISSLTLGLLGASPALAGPLDLDPGFSSGGVAGNVLDNAPVAVARDPQGRTVVASAGAVTRLTATGAIDPSFNGGQAQTFAITATSLAVAADGSVYVGGRTLGVGAPARPTVLRYTAAGAADPAFGTALVPYTDTNAPIAGVITAIAAGSGGAYATGRSLSGGSPAFVTRLDPTGVDSTFGDRGVALVPGVADLRAVTPTGTGVSAAGCATGSSTAFTTVRLTAAGTLDGAFGTGGVATTASLDDGGGACAEQVMPRGGGLLVAGSARGGARTEVTALTASGGIDAGFQRRLLDWPGATTGSPAAGLDRDATGNITVVSGMTHGGVTAAGLWRLRDDGTDDPSLAPGTATPAAGTVDLPGFVAPLQADAGSRTPVALAGGAPARVAQLGTANRAPSVGSVNAPGIGFVGQAITVTATGTDPDAGDRVAGFSIDFGDGTTGTGASAQHTYGAPGSYLVTVRATDENGAQSAPSSTTVLVINVPGDSTATGDIVSPGAKLVTGVPFGFSIAGLGVSPAENGPARVDWDFGDAQPAWTNADLFSPGTRPFRVDASGMSAKHAFPVVIGADPTGSQGAQAELRKTYLVRARISDRFDRALRTVATVVTVHPNRAPSSSASWAIPAKASPVPGMRDGDPPSAPSYAADLKLWAPAADPDGPLDRVVTERWDFDANGTWDTTLEPTCRITASADAVGEQDRYTNCKRQNAVSVNLFALLLKGRAPLTEALSYADQFLPPEERANLIAAKAAQLGTNGVAATAAPRKVVLSQTDGAGQTSVTTTEIAFERWRAPNPELTFPDSLPSSAPKQGAPSGVVLNDPVLADSSPGAGDGSNLTIDLSRSTVDRHAQVAFHVLKIGLPAPPPCADPKLKKNCKFDQPPGLGSVVKTVVVQGNGKVVLTFPLPSQAGKPWSIQDTMYDQTGATGVARYDGFAVSPAGEQTCGSVQGQPFGQATFAADCVSTADGQHILWTRGSVNINGFELRAPATKDPNDPMVAFVVKCASTRFIGAIEQSKVPKTCAAGLPDSGGDLSVVIDDQAVAELPYDPKQKASVFSKQGTFGLHVVSQARYKGLRVASSGLLAFTIAPGGNASALMTTLLPKGFGAAEAGPSTGAAKVLGHLEPHGVVITRFDGVGQFALNQRPRKRARRATADCSSGSSIAMPEKLTVGGFSLSELGTLCYDPKTDTFEAKTKIDVLDKVVLAHMILRGGKLELIEGSATLDVPVGGGLKIERFSFRITDTGTFVMQASADFADVTGTIKGRGTLTVTPSIPEVKLEADVNIAVLPAHARFIVNPDGVGLHATAGRDFGPVSLTASVDGAFGPSGFYVQGTGNACLVACLKVSALVSNEAVAGCGELNVVLTTIAAGFGYRFKPGKLDVWTGSCDLSSYRPAGLASLAELRAVRASATPSLGVPPPPTAVGSGWSVPTRPKVAAVSIVVKSPVRGATPTPQVALDYVKGPLATPLAHTTEELGGVTRTPSGVVIDQDPVTGEVRFIVPSPPPTGSYVVRPTGGDAISAPVYAYGSPPVTKKIFTAFDLDLVPKKGRAAIVKDNAIVVGAKPGGASPISAGARIKGQAARTSASAARAGVKPTASGGIVTPSQFDKKNPDGVPPKPTVIAENALRSEDLTAYEVGQLRALHVKGDLPPGEQIHFMERGANGSALMAAVVADEDGEFEATLKFGTVTVLDESKRCIDAVVTTPEGTPRGSIKGLVCYKVKRIPVGDTGLLDSVSVDPAVQDLDARFKQPRVLGDQPMAVIVYSKGRVKGSVAVSPALIEASQGAGGARATGSRAGRRRAAAARAFGRRPVRSRVWRYRISLPKGPGKATVQVIGARRLGHARGAVKRSRTFRLSSSRRTARVR